MDGKKTYLNIILVLGLFFFGCVNSEDVTDGQLIPMTFDEFEHTACKGLDQISVVDYLRGHLLPIGVDSNMKRLIVEQPCILGIGDYLFITLDEFEPKWISQDELEFLWSLIYSKQQCLPTMNIVSSIAPRGLSTIGVEAMFLITLYNGSSWLTSDQLFVEIGQDSLVERMLMIERFGW